MLVLFLWLIYNVSGRKPWLYEEGLDKNNNKIVNYTYKISSVSDAHTIVVTCNEGNTVTMLIKADNNWRELSFSKIYKKVNNVWVEQSDITTAFDTQTNYVHVT